MNDHTGWYARGGDDVLRSLGSSLRGLTEAEAAARRARIGENLLPGRRRSVVLETFLRQVRSTLIVILLVAAAISFALGDTIDAQVILAAVVLNVVVGFVQEIRAERALQSLKSIVTFTTIVRRDGAERQIVTRQLVPGDVVILRAGMKVPADVRLTRVNRLLVNEAALTGESREVEKTNRTLSSAAVLAEQRNMAFFGTTVGGGEGEGVVVETGRRTEVGAIAQSIATIKEEPTPLQRRLALQSRVLAAVILGVSLLIFVLGLSVGLPLVQMFTTAVAVAVAALPEGMLVAITVVLAIGMQRILKRKSIVRSLVAAETLGSTTVIGIDKTGTLTEGEMRVVKVITPEESVEVPRHHLGELPKGSPEGLLKILTMSVLCSDATIENPDDAFEHWRIIGNPTEKGLLHVAEQLGVHERTVRREQPRLDAVPFDPSRKFMVTLHRVGRDRVAYAKGAPEVILKSATQVELGGRVVPLTEKIRARIEADHRRMSREGLRLLGFSYRIESPDAKALPADPGVALEKTVFVGLAALKDPLRADARETMDLVRRAGITPVILTGDHKLTAQTIAAELGLPNGDENIIDSPRFEKLTETELAKVVPNISVYSRVSPLDKLRIIDAWQKTGAVVAMTGDGVNDAPALKSADIGIALGSGTDVAKEAADIILLDNRFSTIAHAIEQGRIIFENIRKVVLYLVSDSFTEVVIIAASLLAGFPLPLLASQILWINLITDGFPSVALTVDPGNRDVMRQPPVPRSSPILRRRDLLTVAIVSLVTGIGGLVLFLAYWHGDNASLDYARTVTFAAVSIDSLFYVYSLRDMHHPLFRGAFWSNPWLFLATIFGLGAQVFAIYHPFFQGFLRTVPLSLTDWLAALTVPAAAIVALEIIKWSKLRSSPDSTLRRAEKSGIV